MNRRFAAAVLLVLWPGAAASQISVNPTGVNVNTFAETVVFLTYGGLVDYEPVEALWCGQLEPAFPAEGFRCTPSSILGAALSNFDRPVFSGSNGLTDLMTIPAAVSRRAYERALTGAPSEFFYVRRFRSPSGGPDIYVAVTCRLAGGGARVPFALLDMRLTFDVESPVLTVPAGGTLPPVSAEFRYNGTGQLVGRWEVVLPGDELPEASDLLPEASLPVEARSLQRRYLELERFSVFLPPSPNPVTLPGPDPQRIPTELEGSYQLLLRIEATADREGDTDLRAVGAGTGVVYTGGAAAFPIPPLRYYVGNASVPMGVSGAGTLRALAPANDAQLPRSEPVLLQWDGISGAGQYRVELDRMDGTEVLRALLGPGSTWYRIPPWVLEDLPAAPSLATQEEDSVRILRWRVVALSQEGRRLVATPWVHFQMGGAP